MATHPPRLQPSVKGMAAIQRVSKNQNLLDKYEAQSTASVFQDKSSPGTRKMREHTRANFEYFVELVWKASLTTEIWTRDTIIERTKKFLSAWIDISEGKLQNKPKVGVLWVRFSTISWWAIRFIPEFLAIFPRWHRETTSHIHYLAVTEELSTLYHAKFNLGEVELQLFYQQIFQQKQGLDNWKQLYTAWVMTWMCGVRPGSFTVCPGYARGDPLGIPGKFREIDETLLWNQVTFFRTEEGIGCKVEFIYLKLSRDPYTRKLIEGRRTFTFPPSTNSHRPELDFSQLLLCIAFKRGLFYYETPEELFNGNEKTLRKVSKIDQRPVFLKSDQGRALQQTEGMKESSLNSKLREICDLVGLFERNTMYSFRRTALVESRRTSGTEFAREVANHTVDGDSIWAYDHDSLEDFDMTNFRLKNDSSVSRESLRQRFSQAETRRVTANEKTSCHSRIRWLSIQPFTDNKTRPTLQWRSNLRIL